jgi:hypothetical protein
MTNSPNIAMSIHRKKISYECDCGIDSGDCGRINVFILETCTTSDSYKLYHKIHNDTIVEVISFGDEANIALKKLFSTNIKSETIQLSELEEIKSIND